MRRQALRLEEHDDPQHPVVKLAKERIEELSAQAESMAAALADLRGAQPEGPTAEEIEAMLEGIPDLSEELGSAAGEELIELLDAFDVTVSYDKPSRKLDLSASIAEGLPSESEARDQGGWSQGSEIAGARNAARDHQRIAEQMAA